MIRSRLVLFVLVAVALTFGAALWLANAQDDAEMTPDELHAFIEAYFTAISGQEKPLELLEEYIAPSDQALIDHIAMFEAGFPLYELIADDVVAEGDVVAVRATFRGVHDGEFAGLEPTGIEVEIPLMLFYRIEDGLIAEHWMVADSMGLMQQLGVLPMPE